MNRLLHWLALFLACVATAEAAISVGPSGSGVLTFDTSPAATEWSTAAGLPGSSGNFNDAAALDAAVQTLSAASFTSALPAATGTNPPSVNAYARYNTAGRYLQSRSAGVAATVLMATLQNDTGADLPVLTVSYTMRMANLPFENVFEQIPGLRAYYSRSGDANSWVLIPELSEGNPGPLWARLPLMYWSPGTFLYLLWADDNCVGDPEGAYTLDNFNAVPLVVDPLSGVTIDSPVANQSFPAGTAAIEIRAFSTPGLGAVTNVLFYEHTNFLGQVATPPWPARFLYTNPEPGLHPLTAVGINSDIALTSAVVNITVLLPRLTLTDIGFALAEISWPQPSTGFELQSTGDLLRGPWERVTEPDVPSGGFHRVQVDTFTGTRFFRLERR